MDTQTQMDVTRQWQEHSLAHTCDIILQLGLSSEEELDIDCASIRDLWDNGKGAEVIEQHALRVAEEPSQVDALVEHMSLSISSSSVSPLIPAPFASRLVTPNAFYDKHPDLYELAAALQCPILYNEDADVIGIGSINAIATSTFSQAIQLYIQSIQNIKPLISSVRLNYETWSVVCQRHFKR